MAKRKPTPGVFHGPIAPMASQPGSNPAVINPTIGQPAKGVLGDGLGNTDPTLTPLPASHPNKSLDGKTYGHL
jgi:hypothetical protein